MMHLYAAFRHVQLNAPIALIVTVDHGLRPEAKTEAAFVAKAAQALGFDHHIAYWQGDKPSTSLQAVARTARHGLLRDEALRFGTDCILLGHTLNDQHETYAMRLTRSHQGRGLAGMAPATLYKRDVWFARPLISAAREELRDYLSQSQLKWKDDSSNDDRRFERIRFRQDLCAVDGKPWQEAQIAREAMNAATADYIQAHCVVRKGLELHDIVANVQDNAAAQLGLAYCLALMGGQYYLPSRDNLATLLIRLQKGPANVSGCLVTPLDGVMRIQREARQKTQLMLAPHERALWDHRFLVENRSEKTLIIHGNDPKEPLHEEFMATDLTGKAVDYVTFRRHLAIFDQYLPSFDIKLAQIFASMLDHKAYPLPPL